MVLYSVFNTIITNIFLILFGIKTHPVHQTVSNEFLVYRNSFEFVVRFMILLNVMDGFCLDLTFEDDRKKIFKKY